MVAQDESNLAFVLQSVKNVSFEKRPEPELRDEYDVMVHIQQTGICGSDVHYWQKGSIGEFVLKSPIVLGHESMGQIVKCGSKVKGLKPGDRVAIEPGVPCRRCNACRNGDYNTCEDTVFAATPPHDGTLQKFYTVAGDYCYKLPDTVDDEAGAMVEPTAVAVQIVKRSQLRGGQSVVVFGCGPIGVLCQAVCAAYGASKIIGVDLSQGRRDFAKTFGATGVFQPPAKLPGETTPEYGLRAAEMIKKEFDLPDGADVVLEATGAEPCIQTGVYVARKAGTYVQAGMGHENVLFPITYMCVKALNVYGSIRYTTGVYPTAIDLVGRGLIDVKRLITNRFKFEESEQAFELVRQAREDVVKVVISGVQ